MWIKNFYRIGFGEEYGFIMVAFAWIRGAQLHVSIFFKGYLTHGILITIIVRSCF